MDARRTISDAFAGGQQAGRRCPTAARKKPPASVKKLPGSAGGADSASVRLPAGRPQAKGVVEVAAAMDPGEESRAAAAGHADRGDPLTDPAANE